jgi:uncharacterized membrane protein YfcA
MVHYYHAFFPPYFHLWNIPFLFLASLLGESFGALVGGGSVITLPAILFLGVPLQSAIAINNAGALGTEVGILTETWRKVLANKKLVLLMAIPTTIGGVFGTWFLLHASVAIIKYFMVAAVVFILGYSYFSKDKPKSKSISKFNYVVLVSFLLLMGVYTNFIGLGQGTFGRIAVMSILGMSYIETQGVTSTATMPTRIYSLFVTGFAGLIIWPYLLTKWCANVIAGKYATKFVKNVPDAYMKAVLTVLSIAFVVYLVAFY